MTKYCNICERKTHIKKHYGAGTVIAIICTVGWWILALPFYPASCVFCKGRNYRDLKPEEMKND